MRVAQPVPVVTAADVERVVRREFSGDDVAAALGMLAEYGTESWHPEVDRVRLAALKLSRGSLEDLRYWTNLAKMDYRDVLAPAEYPRFGTKRASTDEQHNETIRSDWEQYEEWLKR